MPQPQPQPGLLKAGVLFTWQSLNENALLRKSVLGTALGVTLLCLALAGFGAVYTVEGSGGVFSPRLFAILFLPAEFLIYDLIQGNPEPRTSLKGLYLDMRYLHMLWAGIKVAAVFLAPYVGAVLLLVAATSGFEKGAKLDLTGAVGLMVGIPVLTGTLLYLLFRLVYLPLAVARRDAAPVGNAFRETGGKTWSIGCALFWPYVVLTLLTVPMELLGTALERRLGFVGLAPWFLFDAFLTGLVTCVSAAVLAFSRWRMILEPLPVRPDADAASPTTPAQASGPAESAQRAHDAAPTDGQGGASAAAENPPAEAGDIPSAAADKTAPAGEAHTEKGQETDKGQG